VESGVSIALALLGFAAAVLSFWFKRRLDKRPDSERVMMRLSLTVGVVLLVSAIGVGVWAVRAGSGVTATPPITPSPTGSPAESPSASLGPSSAESPTDGPAPIRRSTFAWKATEAIDLDSMAANWGAKPGDWGDVRDIGWTYNGGIGINSNAGEVSEGAPIARSSCEQAWANHEKNLPTMKPGLQFCVFLSGGKVAMLSVRTVLPPRETAAAVATVEIAVWAN
jgi:hypothetical protein